MDDDAYVVGPGEFLGGQPVYSRTRTYRLTHHEDGDVAVYRVADDVPVWRTGTAAPDGRSRFGLSDDGDLVVLDGAGGTLWSSGTAGKHVVRAVLRDAGWLGLFSDAGYCVWRTPVVPMPHTWEGWSHQGAGSVLHRGETLRLRSLTSPSGRFVLRVDDLGRVRLSEAGGPILWEAVWQTPGSGLSLDQDGQLVWRGPDGAFRWGWLGNGGTPGTPLYGDELAVTDAGELVLRTHDGLVRWTSAQPPPEPEPEPEPEAPRFERREGLSPDERLRTARTPLVRTHFSDPGGWADLLREMARTPSPSGPAEVEPVDDAAFDGLAVEDLMAMVPGDEHSLMFVADAETFSRPEHPVLVVNICDDRGEPYSEDGLFFRAIPEAVSEIDGNLSIANCDWEDFAGVTDDDGVLRETFA